MTQKFQQNSSGKFMRVSEKIMGKNASRKNLYYKFSKVLSGFFQKDRVEQRLQCKDERKFKN